MTFSSFFLLTFYSWSFISMQKPSRFDPVGLNDLMRFLQMPPEKLSKRQRIALDEFYDLNKKASEKLKPQMEDVTRGLANVIDKLNIDFNNF